MIDFGERYRQSQGGGASKVGMVVALYETMIADLARAEAAMRDDNIERRTHEIQHAITVLGVLQGTLNFEKGGRPAQELDRFYSTMRARILEAQLRSSKPILDSVIGYFTEVCEAWREVDLQLTKNSLSEESTGRPSASWTV